MELELSRCTIRPFGPDDADSLARHANSRDVWLNLRDAFPHPYTVDDARGFIDHLAQADPLSSFALVVDGEAAGAIGLVLGTDVERVGAELGYWLGEEYWGRGVVSEAVAAFARAAFDAFDLTRVFALPFERNSASLRVLEKAGFAREGRLRRSAIKDGVVLDQVLFALVRDE